MATDECFNQIKRGHFVDFGLFQKAYNTCGVNFHDNQRRAQRQRHQSAFTRWLPSLRAVVRP